VIALTLNYERLLYSPLKQSIDVEREDVNMKKRSVEKAEDGLGRGLRFISVTLPAAFSLSAGFVI